MADAKGREVDGELTTPCNVLNLNVNYTTAAEASENVKIFVENTKNCCETTENAQIQAFENDISLPSINCSDSLNNSQVPINETESPACEESGEDIHKCEVNSMEHMSEVQSIVCIDSCIQKLENTEASIDIRDNLLRYQVTELVINGRLHVI